MDFSKDKLAEYWNHYGLDTFDDWHVYSYHHLDAWRSLTLVRALGDVTRTEYERIRSRIASHFILHGWEGDGEIDVIWLPAFCIEPEFTEGALVFHVKQANNGTSYIASKYPIPRLKERGA